MIFALYGPTPSTFCSSSTDAERSCERVLHREETSLMMFHDKWGTRDSARMPRGCTSRSRSAIS